MDKEISRMENLLQLVCARHVHEQMKGAPFTYTTFEKVVREIDYLDVLQEFIELSKRCDISENIRITCITNVCRAEYRTEMQSESWKKKLFKKTQSISRVEKWFTSKLMTV